MRLPTLQVVDGVIDPISSHGESFRLVGAGYPQPITDKSLLGKEAIGYLGDCIYRTENAALNLIPLSWTLQLYAHLPAAITVLASMDAQIAAGGWYLTLSSSRVSLYRSALDGNRVYSYLYSYHDFPQGLNKNEPKHYALVKEVNRVKLYVNYQLAAQFSLPTNVGTPGFSIFGITGGKESYSSASTVYCNYLRLDHNYVTPVDEFTRFSETTPREVALSLFDPNHVASPAFDKVHLKKVRNFAPPLVDSDFVGAAGLIPPLTADVGPVWAVAASDLYSASYPAWKAFPGTNYVVTHSELWASSTSAGDKWLSVRRVDNQPFLVNAFRITDGSIDGYRGIDYKLQGKNATDVNWTDLYSAVDVPVTPDLSHYFVNIGNHFYSQYRVLFTKYAPVNKRMAVSMFQLYYVEGDTGSKSFELTNNAKEVTIVKSSTKDGNYIQNLTFSGESYPRSMTITLSDGTVLPPLQQTIIEVGTGFPWTGSGYLAKTAQGQYYTKPMEFENFTVTPGANGLIITYAAPSAFKYSIDSLDSYAYSGLPATEFTKLPTASVWTDIPLTTRKLKNSEVVSTVVKKLKAGKYLVRGVITLASPSGAMAILTNANGDTLLQSLGCFGGKLGDTTVQINLTGQIDLLTDTNVTLKVYAVVATKTSTSLASKVLIKSEHTKINFFRV